MRIIFGNWKYIVKNFLFVLPFSLIPALFLGLSLDYAAIKEFVNGLYEGSLTLPFETIFRTWSLIRVDSWLGAIYGVCAVFCSAVFMALMLSLVEKHMRIGKRTLSGVFTQLWNHLLLSLFITFIYIALYELWALLTAAVLYAVGGLIPPSLGGLALGLIVIAGMIAVLAFFATTWYLWFPCLQLTGFSLYEGFRYSYLLMLNVRTSLFLSFIISLVFTGITIGLSAFFLPEYVFYLVAFVLFTLLFLSFCIRMETTYFYADRLDREDIIRSYRGI